MFGILAESLRTAVLGDRDQSRREKGRSVWEPNHNAQLDNEVRRHPMVMWPYIKR